MNKYEKPSEFPRAFLLIPKVLQIPTARSRNPGTTHLFPVPKIKSWGML